MSHKRCKLSQCVDAVLEELSLGGLGRTLLAGLPQPLLALWRTTNFGQNLAGKPLQVHTLAVVNHNSSTALAGADGLAPAVLLNSTALLDSCSSGSPVQLAIIGLSPLASVAPSSDDDTLPMDLAQGDACCGKHLLLSTLQTSRPIPQPAL